MRGRGAGGCAATTCAETKRGGRASERAKSFKIMPVEPYRAESDVILNDFQDERASRLSLPEAAPAVFCEAADSAPNRSLPFLESRLLFRICSALLRTSQGEKTVEQLLLSSP